MKHELHNASDSREESTIVNLIDPMGRAVQKFASLVEYVEFLKTPHGDLDEISVVFTHDDRAF
jgi:hypothetical protein